MVEKADSLFSVEAMKMRLVVRAPFSGRVAKIANKLGGLVSADEVIVTLEPHRKEQENTAQIKT